MAQNDDWEDVKKPAQAGAATADEWEDVPSVSAEEKEPEQLPGGTERLKAQTGGKSFKAPRRIERETPQIPENYGFTPWNIAKGVGQGVSGVIGSTAQGLYDLALGEGKNAAGEEEHGLGGLVGYTAGGWNPAARAKWLAQKYITEPAGVEAEKARQLEAASRQEEAAGTPGSLGHAVEAVGHRIAAGIPLVGPWAASLGERSGTGDVGGAVGEAGGAALGGELMSHPVEVAKTTGRVGDLVARGTPLTEAGRLEAAKRQALTVKKPSMTETEYAGKVDAAMPELQRIAQANAGKIKTPRQAVQAISDRITQIEEPIRQHLENVPDAQQMVGIQNVNGVISRAIDDALARKQGHFTPEEIQKAKDSVFNFVGDQDKPLRELEGNRRRLNADADGYFNSSPADKRQINASDATALAQRAAANAIRDVEYGTPNIPGEMERIGLQATDSRGNPTNFRDVRKMVGNLTEIRDHFEDAMTRAEATGDWKAFDVMRKGPSLAMGGLGAIAGGVAGGGLGAVLGTLLGEGGKAWADYRKSTNPNLNVTKMFRNLADTSRPNTLDITAQMPQPALPAAPAARLPAPATPMPGPVPVGGSPGFQNNRWVTPAGQLPPVQPIQPTFIREIPPAGVAAPPAPRIAGQLPESLAPVPRETNIPPEVEPQFAREDVGAPLGERRPETVLGTPAGGIGGVRQNIKALLPNISGEAERGWLLIRSTLDQLEAGERPGRYYDETEQGAHNLKENFKTGTRRSGQWRGVKSMRTMLPWLQDNESLTPEDLRHALRQAARGKITPVMRSAIEFEKNRAAKAPPEEPEEEVPF